jgi:hypothetical protein
MKVLDKLAKVKLAQLQMAAARQDVATPMASLLDRGQQHPLTTVGLAAGAGFVLGSLNVSAMRVPGLGPLLSGGMAEAISMGTRLLTELGTAGLAAAAMDDRADSREATARRDPTDAAGDAA